MSQTVAIYFIFCSLIYTIDFINPAFAAVPNKPLLHLRYLSQLKQLPFHTQSIKTVWPSIQYIALPPIGGRKTQDHTR